MRREAIAARREVVVAMTARGVCAREIAAALGVSDRLVSRDRVAAGVDQPRPPRWTAAEHERAMELYADGCSSADVARTIGRSYSAVCTRYRGMGWSPAETGVYNKARRLAGYPDGRLT